MGIAVWVGLLVVVFLFSLGTMFRCGELGLLHSKDILNNWRFCLLKGKGLKADNGITRLLLSPAIPVPVIAAVVIASLLPLALILMGVHLEPGNPLVRLPDLTYLSEREMANNLHLAMLGSQLHLLLEWCSIMVAILAAVLAFSRFGITRHIATPVIGISLLCAGLMDAFHSLISVRLIDAVADVDVLGPFSWAAARSFSAMILMIAVLALLMEKRLRWNMNASKSLVIVGGIFFLLGYLLALWCISSEHIPQTVYSEDLITHPFDVIPLVIWIICGAFVFPRFQQKFPSIFADALALSVLPSVMVELHMVFGSVEQYDSHYFAAHFLKIVAYGVPFIGLLLDYLITYHRDQMKTEQLHQTYRELDDSTQQLLKSNRSLEKTNQYKSEFMASMSHELRTPLNSVIGFGRILMKDFGEGRNPRGYRAVEAIFRNATHLLGLINDILDLSRIDAGRMKLNKTDFIVSDVISEVKTELWPMVQEKNIEFNVVNYARNVAIVSDRAKLKQILLNLGSNAIKYTEAGSVTISVEREKEGSLGNCIKISFKDTGVGITESEKETLFSEFSREEDVEDRDAESAGLGLKITAKLTQLLGGNIEFDSEYGVGSEFRVYFPMSEDALNSGVNLEGQWHRKGLAVACVDADVDVLSYFDMAFSDAGISVFTESSSNRMMRLCEDVLPDVICFEADMPEKNGGQLLREFYNNNLMADVGKIALSSNHDLERQLLTEGADVFVKKPFSAEALIDHVMVLAIRDISSVLAVGAETEHEESLCAEFELRGIQVFFVDSADEAIEKMAQFLPDCVVINLGDVGADVTRLIMSLQNDEQCRKIPQVLYNGLDLQRKQAFSNDVQEEIRQQYPSAEEILYAVFTLRRRAKTSLMRIEALNRSLKDAENTVDLNNASLDSNEAEAEAEAEVQRVLVVEDSKDNLELMDWILEDANIPHDCVNTGRGALKAVLQKQYAVLLLDINLPDLNGREVARRLRATKSYRSVPIIAVTVHSSAGDIKELQAGGIDAVIDKPVDPERLLAVLHRHCDAWKRAG